MSACRTPAIVDGITRLIRAFDGEAPGEPFPDWNDTRKVRVGASDGISAYRDPASLARTALEAFAAIPRIYGGLHSGVVGHLLTVAHALLLLERMGYTSLCERGCEAHRVYIKLSRHVPTEGDLLLREAATPVLPFQARFWAPTLQGQHEWAFGHVFKYAYSFFDLIQFVDDPVEIARYTEQLETLYTWR